MELATFVLGKGGFINFTTPLQTEKRMGSAEDIYSESELPKGEFTVWRICLDDRTFTDEDLAEAVRLCQAAGSVSNVNLHGSGVTASGMAELVRMTDTLVCLKLTETSAFTAESVPFLAACKNLRHLFVTESTGDAAGSSVQSQIELIRKLQELLPECRVHLE